MSTDAEEHLLAECARLGKELAAAEEALTQERFKGIPRLSKGTVILVPRKLFGATKWWPAKICGVHLRYSSGASRDGTPWERKDVSYSVFLQQKDGAFGGSSEGYYASEIAMPPEEAP